MLLLLALIDPRAFFVLASVCFPIALTFMLSFDGLLLPLQDAFNKYLRQEVNQS